MATYNMSEFRANLAEAFNRVAEGEAVYISRGNQQFRLTARASRKPKTDAVVAEPQASQSSAIEPANVEDMDLPNDIKEAIRQSRQEYARGEGTLCVSLKEAVDHFMSL